MVLAIQSLNFIPNNGVLNTIFHKTVFTIQIAGFPKTPYSLTLIGLIIIMVIAIAANGITEKLTSKKVGLMTAVLITILGSALFSAYVKLPFDFQLEGVRVVAALLGAIVIAVFYTLLRGKGSK